MATVALAATVESTWPEPPSPVKALYIYGNDKRQQGGGRGEDWGRGGEAYAGEAEADEADEQDLGPRVRVEAEEAAAGRLGPMPRHVDGRGREGRRRGRGLEVGQQRRRGLQAGRQRRRRRRAAAALRRLRHGGEEGAGVRAQRSGRLRGRDGQPTPCRGSRRRGGAAEGCKDARARPTGRDRRRYIARVHVERGAEGGQDERQTADNVWTMDP